MKPTELIESLNSCLPARRPIFIWGQPGIGKSAITLQVADALNMEFLDVRLLYKDPVDLRGLPTVADGTARWVPPSDLPFKAVRKENPRDVLLFLDELPQAPPMVQNTASQLVLDRKVGEHELADNVYIVAAGNRAEDRAATFEMPSHLANRFIHLDLEVDFDDWKVWAIQNDVHHTILAFLSKFPQHLNNFKPTERTNATPRSWEILSDVLPGLTARVTDDVVAGIIGPGLSIEYMSFQKYFKEIPGPREVLDGPDDVKNYPTEDEPDLLYALCNSVVSAMKSSDYDNFLKFLYHVPKEFGILSLKDGLTKSMKFKKRMNTSSEWVGITKAFKDYIY